MAMVNTRDVRLAIRRRFLGIPSLPSTIQYEGQLLPNGAPSGEVWINEISRPVEQFARAFGVSQATGVQIYEVIAQMDEAALINQAYDVAHEILERFEHGLLEVDVDGTRYEVVKSYLGNTGRRNAEPNLYFVPVVVFWRSFSELA